MAYPRGESVGCPRAESVVSPGTRGVVADITRFVEQTQAADAIPRLNSGMFISGFIRYVVPPSISCKLKSLAESDSW